MSACQEILPEFNLKIRKGGSTRSVSFWYSPYHHWIQNTVSFTLKYRGSLYPVRNNGPPGFEPFGSAHGPEYVEGSQRLEFLTGFTSGAIFSIIYTIACGAPVPIGTSGAPTG